MMGKIQGLLPQVVGPAILGGSAGRSRKPVYRFAVPWVRIPPPPLAVLSHFPGGGARGSTLQVRNAHAPRVRSLDYVGRKVASLLDIRTEANPRILRERLELRGHLREQGRAEWNEIPDNVPVTITSREAPATNLPESGHMAGPVGDSQLEPKFAR